MFNDLVNKQRDYFKTGESLSVDFRRAALKKLLLAVEENESVILEALKADLNKHATEAYIS